MFTPLIVTGFDGFGVTKHEGDPSRRPLTYDEIQALFDPADARVEQIRAPPQRCDRGDGDAALLKSVYAFGIRRREAWGLVAMATSDSSSLRIDRGAKIIDRLCPRER